MVASVEWAEHMPGRGEEHFHFILRCPSQNLEGDDYFAATGSTVCSQFSAISPSLICFS